MGAKVEYFPAEKRIDIDQNGKKYLLHPGVEGATVDAQIVPLAAPKMVGGRAFVPLRSLAELFGYRVAWLDAQRTVAIYTRDDIKPVMVDHRAELSKGGAFGVEIDFADVDPAQIPVLLDAAKAAGAGMIKTRFDWGTLEPEKDGAFLWTTYDTVVREARTRGLRVIGVLGNSTKWASVSASSETDEWRNSPPKEKEFEAWANYVKRVVGRYRVDVQAWQVWENPSAENFRSVPRTYRKLTRLAVDAARVSDPKAVIHAAEPGGVELDFIHDLTSNGLTPLLDGVQVFPVSQWQPGVPNSPETFVLPYATLRDRLQVSDGKKRDYWLGGVSAPAYEAKSADVTVSDAQQRLLATYSPTAQADYLVRMFSLALASGADKVFWNPLQDPAPGTSANATTTSGAGLYRADGTPRLALSAFKLFSQNVAGKPYAGNLAFDNNAIALLFDDKKSGTLVAWAPTGGATLALSSSGVNAQTPNTTFVATRPDSQVLDSSGAVVAPADGLLKLTSRPVFITNVALETATTAATRQGEGTLRLASQGTSYAKVDEVKATFAESGGEDGLFWRPFTRFGGMARHFDSFEGKSGLTTESQRDIMDLNSAKPFIYLDVADDFMYYADGQPVTITVEVHRPAPQPGGLISASAGFRVEYDSPKGYKSTPYQVVEEGEGWATYTFNVPDASFANAEGYDVLINSGGSKRDLTFASISVKRGATPPAPIAVARTE